MMDLKPLRHVYWQDSSDSTMVYRLIDDNKCDIRNIITVEASSKKKRILWTIFKSKLKWNGFHELFT